MTVVANAGATFDSTAFLPFPHEFVSDWRNRLNIPKKELLSPKTITFHHVHKVSSYCPATTLATRIFNQEEYSRHRRCGERE
jgi:hypothetical protein